MRASRQPLDGRREIIEVAGDEPATAQGQPAGERRAPALGELDLLLRERARTLELALGGEHGRRERTPRRHGPADAEPVIPAADLERVVQRALRVALQEADAGPLGQHDVVDLLLRQRAVDPVATITSPASSSRPPSATASARNDAALPSGARS